MHGLKKNGLRSRFYDNYDVVVSIRASRRMIEVSLNQSNFIPRDPLFKCSRGDWILLSVLFKWLDLSVRLVILFYLL